MKTTLLTALFCVMVAVTINLQASDNPNHAASLEVGIITEVAFAITAPNGDAQNGAMNLGVAIAANNANLGVSRTIAANTTNANANLGLAIMANNANIGSAAGEKNVQALTALPGSGSSTA